MRLFLSAGQTVKDVNRIFNDRFPYLRLEFFLEKPFVPNSDPTVKIVPGNTALKSISGIMKEGEIEITANQTISDIEQQFQEKFRLPVQVYRKSRIGWLKTIQSDGYTLGKQNKMGRMESNAMYDKKELL